MIDVSLEYVRKVLDQYLSTRYGVETNFVVLNNLISPDGSVPQKNNNKLVITLVTLEYETSKQFYSDQKPTPDRLTQINPPIWFNLDILISANFDEYSEALKFLTATIGFFQANTVMNRANQPALPVGLTGLKFEIENSPTGKMENIWMALGAKYLPSIIYKIRQVYVQADQIEAEIPLVQNISSGVQN
ncbi:MAG: DUF4255 domain-containing protein [Burkholderiales bacterium]|nr:DUF4255 domain-containing protein [Burkholderiales bacterium]